MFTQHICYAPFDSTKYNPIQARGKPSRSKIDQFIERFQKLSIWNAMLRFYWCSKKIQSVQLWIWRILWTVNVETRKARVWRHNVVENLQKQGRVGLHPAHWSINSFKRWIWWWCKQSISFATTSAKRPKQAQAVRVEMLQWLLQMTPTYLCCASLLPGWHFSSNYLWQSVNLGAC